MDDRSVATAHSATLTGPGDEADPGRQDSRLVPDLRIFAAIGKIRSRWEDAAAQRRTFRRASIWGVEVHLLRRGYMNRKVVSAVAGLGLLALAAGPAIAANDTNPGARKAQLLAQAPEN